MRPSKQGNPELDIEEACPEDHARGTLSSAHSMLGTNEFASVAGARACRDFAVARPGVRRARSELARLLLASSVVMGCFAPATLASAQQGTGGDEPSGEDRQAAAEAYDRGRAAFLARDYERAAEWFETADRLAPAELALEAAVRANQRAGRTARSATLALALQQRYPGDTNAQELAASVLRQTAPRLGRVAVACNTRCQAELDGALQVSTTFFVEPGRHAVVVHFRTGRVERSVDAIAGREQRIEVQAPPDTGRGGGRDRGGDGGPRDASSLEGLDLNDDGEEDGEADGRRRRRRDDDEDEGGGLPSPVFWISAATTVGLGAALVWSGLDTQSGADEYESLVEDYETGRGTRSAAEAALEDGRDREMRTNLLIGATAVVGAATVVFAVLTDWGGADDGDDRRARRDRARATMSPRLVAGPTSQGGAVSIQGRW